MKQVLYNYCNHHSTVFLIIIHVSHLYPSDFSTLPWPLRVYESEECVVELLMGHNNDLQYTADQFAKESNYTCLLHWYGSDGTQRKVDLRKLIRKERKRVSYYDNC